MQAVIKSTLENVMINTKLLSLHPDCLFSFKKMGFLQKLLVFQVRRCSGFSSEAFLYLVSISAMSVHQHDCFLM